MNPALTIEQERAQRIGLSELLTFVGLPSKRSARELSGSAEELFKGITGVLDDLLLRTIDRRTRAEFVAMRSEVFFGYFKAVVALSNLATVIVPKPIIEKLVVESFSELEAELRDEGLARFGTAARDQAVFTVWTFRKISRMISTIAAAPPAPKEIQREDERIAAEFSFCAAWAQFHLDCLVVAIRFDKAVSPGALSEICDGLRAAANAYGLIRQGVELRVPPAEATVQPYIWDEEDQELLDSSMRDLERQIILEHGPSWSDEGLAHHNAPDIVIPSAAIPRPSRIFGTHIREGIEIIKDWLQSSKK
jgi:hypothetical protein